MIKITLSALLGICSINCVQASILDSIGSTLNAAGAAASSIERSVSGAVKTASGAVKTASTEAVELSAARLQTAVSDMQMKLQTRLEVANASAKTHVANALMQANNSYTHILNHLEQLEQQLQQVNMSNSPAGKVNIQRLVACIYSNILVAEPYVNAAAIFILRRKARMIRRAAEALVGNVAEALVGNVAVDKI